MHDVTDTAVISLPARFRMDSRPHRIPYYACLLGTGDIVLSAGFGHVGMNHLCGIDDLIKHVFGYEAQFECGLLER